MLVIFLTCSKFQLFAHLCAFLGKYLHLGFFIYFNAGLSVFVAVCLFLGGGWKFGENLCIFKQILRFFQAIDSYSPFIL